MEELRARGPFIVGTTLGPGLYKTEPKPVPISKYGFTKINHWLKKDLRGWPTKSEKVTNPSKCIAMVRAAKIINNVGYVYYIFCKESKPSDSFIIDKDDPNTYVSSFKTFNEHVKEVLTTTVESNAPFLSLSEQEIASELIHLFIFQSTEELATLKNVLQYRKDVNAGKKQSNLQYEAKTSRPMAIIGSQVFHLKRHVTKARWKKILDALPKYNNEYGGFAKEYLSEFIPQ